MEDTVWKKEKRELYRLIELKFKCIWRLLPDESADVSTAGLHYEVQEAVR